MPQNQQSNQPLTDERADPNEAKFETLSPTRHVGRTLEAEGIFTDVLGHDLPTGDPLPERREPGQLGIDTVEIRSFDEDRAYQEAVGDEDARRESPAGNSGDSTDRTTPVGDPLEGAGSPLADRLENPPEALKTRLPGDTSSDPHTDLGADNATTAHASSDEESEAAAAR